MYLAYGARAMAAVALAAATLGVAAASTNGTVPAPTVAGVAQGCSTSSGKPRGARRPRPSASSRSRSPATTRPSSSGRTTCALYSRGVRRQGRDDRRHRPVRLADHRPRPARLRSRRGRAQPALAADHQARGQGPRLQPEQRQHGRLGQRDHAGRGVRAHDRTRREDPAGRDAAAGGPGPSASIRWPGPEDFMIRHHLGSVISQSFVATEQAISSAAIQVAARRLPGRERRARHGARRLWRQRCDRLPVEPAELLHPSGDSVEASDPLVTAVGRNPPGPGRQRQPQLGGHGVERHLQPDGEPAGQRG